MITVSSTYREQKKKQPTQLLNFWLPWPVFLTSPCSHFKALVMPRICLSITTNEHTEVHRQLEQISHLHLNASADDCRSIIALLECICITFNVEKNQALLIKFQLSSVAFKNCTSQGMLKTKLTMIESILDKFLKPFALYISSDIVPLFQVAVT